jgi:chemotaxis protein histidine kinase CheA
LFQTPLRTFINRRNDLAKVVLNTIGSRYGSIDALNANFAAIEEAFENTLSRDGTGPNALEANLDAGSYRIINLPTPTANSDAATKEYVDIATSIINSYLEEIEVVSENIEAVITVAGIAETLTDNLEAINDVASNIEEVVGVANNIGSVELVGLDLNGNFQQGVVYDFGAITDPAVGEVEESTSSIVIVANNIDDITSVANNLTDIQNAEENAAAAAASALAAATSETNAQTAEANAETAEQAAELAQAAAEAAQVAAEAAESNAATSESNAAASEAAASGYADVAVEAKDDAITAQLAAESALASTLAAYDQFDDRYLGAKTEDPTTDNDGDPLVGGALYFLTGAGMKVWTGTTWEFAYVPGGTYLAKANNLSDLTNTTTARSNLGLGSAAVTSSTDYATAAQGALADTAFQTASAGALAYLSTVGTTEITNNAVTVDKLAATLDYGSIV